MPEPIITSATITIRGRVNSQVTTVLADNIIIPLQADKTFTHRLVAPLNGVVQITTRDARGLSETRVVQIITTNQPAPPPMPSAAT